MGILFRVPPTPTVFGRGYFGGGNNLAEIDGIQFDTEAAINPTAALSVARRDLAGVQSGSL